MKRAQDPLIAGAKRSSTNRGRQAKRTKGAGDYFALEKMWKRIRFLNGQYEQQVWNANKGEIVNDVLPYIEILMHWDNQQRRTHQCSAGIDEMNSKPCVGCSLDIRPSPNRVFTIIHLAHYHKTPWVKNNKIQRKKDGETVMIDKECEGKNCKMCASNDEKFFGKRLHMKLGLQHFGQLISKVEDLSQDCKCGGKLLQTQFECPQCENVLIDMDDPKCELSEKEVYDARENGYYCPHCRYMVDLIPIAACDSCEDPQPVTVFDLDVELRKMDSGTGRDKRTVLDVKFGKAGPIDKQYEGPTDPLPLQDIFAPKSIPDQKRDWKYRGEITNAAVSDESEAYGEENAGAQ
jgi:hypothetical protein